MDAESFRLLHGVVRSQSTRLRKTLATLAENERGSTYVRFVALHLDAIDALVGTTAIDYAAAGSLAERIVLGRKLYRLDLYLKLIHSNVFDYRRDVGRRDIPVGLLYLIDTLIADLLKASADPLVHSDGQFMYSTERILDQWEQVSASLGVTWAEPAEPVIFNLPGLDPANALLSPILAHEVGHSVIRRVDMVADLEAQLDAGQVDQLKFELQAADPNVDVNEVLQQFGRWAEELLCDALATELTGPSLLLSGAAFLPASAAGNSGSNHPDPAQRIAMTLRQLSENGWDGPLLRLAPGITSWLRDVVTTPPAVDTPRETFLRSLVDISVEKIIEIARSYIDQPFEFGVYSPVEEEVRTLIHHGIPPAEVAGASLSPWQVIVGCWLHGIVVHSDTAEGITLALDDAELSQFALKTVEMARVLQLWRAA